MRPFDFVVLGIAILAVILIPALGLLSRQGMHYRADTKPSYSPPVPSDSEAKLRTDLDRANALIDTMRQENAVRVSSIVREFTEKEARLIAETAEQRERLRAEFAEAKRNEAKLTAQRSRVALVAKIAEHMAPLLAGFPYNFKEVRHVGEIFDFLVYDGLEDGYIKEVVFLEIKSNGKSRSRNPRERMLKDAIDNGRVRYEFYAPDTRRAEVANGGVPGNNDDDNSANDD